MRDLTVELKQLRLHGMAAAWTDLVEPGANAGLEDSRWLIEHLLQAEASDRALRSVSHQMHSAKFPVHRDLAGFDFEVSPVDQKLVLQLAELSFTEQAHNVVLVGGGEATTYCPSTPFRSHDPLPIPPAAWRARDGDSPSQLSR
jgi:DNA replication protein DnaC